MANYQDTFSSVKQPDKQGNTLAQYAIGGSGIQQQPGVQQTDINPFNPTPPQQGINNAQQGMMNQQLPMQQMPVYGQQGMQYPQGMNPNQVQSPYIQQQQQMQADPNARINQLMRYGSGGV